MADQRWEPDGTEPLPAPNVWEDPLSGLVTGSAFEEERFTVDVADPVVPDMTEVRRAVDAVLAGEDLPKASPIPAPRRRSVVPAHTPGIVAPNPRPGWPRNPSARQLPGLRSQQRTGQFSRPAPPLPPPPRRQLERRPGSRMGFGLIIVLLLVFAVIIITIIGSLLNTISDIIR